MKPNTLLPDAGARRAMHQASRAIHRGDLVAAERWMSVCETRLAHIERLAAIAAQNFRPVRPHRAADRRPPPPPPPPAPPPPPPRKITPAPPGDTVMATVVARMRLEKYAKLFIVPPELRPPRHRTPPKQRT